MFPGEAAFKCFFSKKRKIKTGPDCYLSNELGLFLIFQVGVKTTETATYGRSHESLEASSRMLPDVFKEKPSEHVYFSQIIPQLKTVRL